MATVSVPGGIIVRKRRRSQSLVRAQSLVEARLVKHYMNRLNACFLKVYKNPAFRAAVSSVLFLALGAPLLGAERQTLPGHVPAVTARLQPIARLAGSTPMTLAIGLPLRGQTDLHALLQEIYDP